MNRLIRSLVIVSILVTFASSAAWAGEVENLNTFNAGDPAVAAEVNANFSAVKTAVDGNASDLTEHESNPSAHHAAPIVNYGFIEHTGINVWIRQDVGSLTLTTPNPGLVIVRFDGWVELPPDTSLWLGVSETSSLFEIGLSGHVQISRAATATTPSEYYSFSHSMGYPVSAGDKTFYAVAESWRDETANVSIYGTLTAQYYPNN